MVTNHRDADDRNKRTLFQNKLMFGLFPAPTGTACGHPMTNQRVPLGRNEAYVTAELMTDVLLLRSAAPARSQPERFVSCLNPLRACQTELIV